MLLTESQLEIKSKCIFLKESISFKVGHLAHLIVSDLTHPSKWGATQKGDYSYVKERLIKVLSHAKDMNDISYIRKDVNMGINQLNKLAENIDKASDKTNKNRYDEKWDHLRDWIEDGLTSKAVRDHIKWLKTEYRKMIDEKAKKIQQNKGW